MVLSGHRMRLLKMARFQRESQFSRTLQTGCTGPTVGRFAGNLDRTLVRAYGEEGVSGNVDTYVESGVWSWTGWSLTAGASADFESLRVAASVQVPSELSGTASADTRGSDRSFTTPVQYRVGATAVLGPSIQLHGSAVFADWSKMQDDLPSGYKEWKWVWIRNRTF